MTQIETLMEITTILKNLPSTVNDAGGATWQPLPAIPFALPLGKPVEYMRIGNHTRYRKPSNPVIFTPAKVQAILAGQPVGWYDESGETMSVLDMLKYLDFAPRRKLAEVILKEYEMELALNDLPDDATVGNGWLPGVTSEGKTLALEVLMGYDGYCGYGVSVDRVDVEWEAYEKECQESGTGIDWNHAHTPKYQLFITPPGGADGMSKYPRMTVSEFLRMLI